MPRAQKPKVTDGLAQLRSDAQAGRWREALATITTAEGAIESARDAGATFFPLPVEAYNLAITACGNGRNHEEALGVLRRLTMGVSPEEGPGSAQAAKRRSVNPTKVTKAEEAIFSLQPGQDAFARIAAAASPFRPVIELSLIHI